MGRSVWLRWVVLVPALALVTAGCYSVAGVPEEDIAAMDRELDEVRNEMALLRTDLRAAEAALAADDGPTEVHPITLADFSISGHLEAKPGTTAFEIANRGATVHNFIIEGLGASPDVNPAEATLWSVSGLQTGTYTVFCSVVGHREAGMETTLLVSPEASAPTTGHEEADYQAMSEAMTASILAFPAATEGRGNQLLDPRIAADGAKEYDLTASIVDWEVSPGKVVQAWAYNGMVPGPMIRVEVGDRVRVYVTNELPMGTDVHFHGVGLPNGMDGVAPLTQPLIEPGETFTYEFTAEQEAVAMYHAHHHAQMQVPNGLFGVFFVGDVDLPLGREISGTVIPDDIELAGEIPMVLNDAGVIGYSLNGKSFPATDPYVFNVGDWYLVHYFNEGLQIHPMHQHQFFGLVVAKDGVPLESPYWTDTLNVAPGERYSVLFHVTDPGAWVWHCHILTHVESEEGMFGMVTAVIAQEG